jgi:hypothetical protein
MATITGYLLVNGENYPYAQNQQNAEQTENR